MIALFSAYEPLFAHVLIDILFALRQFVVLRAGVCALASAGIASLGAYAAAILAQSHGVPPAVAVVAATVLGTGVGVVLSLPLARVRGIYQAIATLAFGQIVISVVLYMEPLTGGALGLNSIPKVVATWHLLVAVVVVVYLLRAMLANSVGRMFNAARQDETVALSLGVSVAKYHVLAFAVSGAIAGLGGALYAFHSYSLVPGQFGFSMLVAALAAVVLGGRVSIFGPIVGAALLALLPEFGRVFASQRYLIHGLLLVLVIILMPHGIVDTIAMRRRKAALARAAAPDAPNVQGAR